MGFLDRLFRRKEDEPTAARQQGDPTESDEYRHADPREVVEEGGVAMSGPGGAPQEGLSVDERRERDREID